MMNKALLAALLLATGCVEERAELQTYQCVALYRCTGDTTISARVVMPCAGDDTEAKDLTMAQGMVFAAEDCGDGNWQYVRPMCEVVADAPASACEVQP